MNTNKIILGSAAVLSLAATSCRDDYDFEADRLQSIDYQYAQSFKERFGTPDPEQNYNMATRVTADVTLPSGTNGSISIYTTSKMNASCKLLAKQDFSDSKFALSFDTQKGNNSLYVEVIDQNGNYVVDGIFSIENGTISIDKTTIETRATGDPVTCITYPNSPLQFKTFNGGTVPCPLPDNVEFSNWGSDYDLIASWTCKTPDNQSTLAGPSEVPNFYLLQDVVLEKTDNRPYIDMYPLFYKYTSSLTNQEKEGPFHEGTNHVQMYFGKHAQESAEAMELDAHLLTKGGECSVTLVGKGTEMKNDIGYYYYPKSEESKYLREDGTLDFLKINKYVLIQDAANRPLLSGTTQNNAYFSDNLNAWNWQQTVQASIQDGYLIVNGQTSNIKYSDLTYQGTKIKLTYFGEGSNWSSTGTYNFPADYVVGFFSIMPDYSYASKYIYCSDHKVEKYTFNEYPRGATFKYKGKTYLGLEDDQDLDINDFVFELGGFKGDIPDVTPEDDPDYEPDPEPNSWLLACEDMGAIGDFDFNDVVFKVAHVAGQNTITFTPLAAGGTLGSVIYRNSERIGEIHMLLNNYSGTSISGSFPMLATQRGNSIAGGESIVYTLPDSEVETFTMSAAKGSTIAGGFQVKVVARGKDVNKDTQNGEYAAIVTAKETGAAPQMLILPGNWIWPTERTHIDNAYPRFSEWVQNAATTDWASDCREQLLVQPYQK